MPEVDSVFVAEVSESAQTALRELAEQFPWITRETDVFLSPGADLISGGKRARARLAHLAWRAAGGEALHEAIIAAGAALELFQGAALIHDDIIDDAHTRRGAPAAHRAFAARHRENAFVGSDVDYGRSAAILLGDLMLALSQRRMLDAARIAPEGSNALDIYSAMCAEVALGQYLDVDAAAHGPKDSDALEKSFTVVRHKSARYSVERPLVLGATLAGGDGTLVAALSDIGEPLGEAFQMRDDELGVFGDPTVTGKPAGDDLAEGKLTPLILIGCEMADSKDAQFIRENLGDRSITRDAVERIRSILTDSGARARHESLIAERQDRATSLIEQTSLTESVGNELTALAISLTTRSY